MSGSKTPPTRRRLRGAFVASFLFVIVAFCSASWFVGGQLVAPANRHVGAPPAGLDAETISTIGESGSALAGWFIPATGIPAEMSAATTGIRSPIVILLHPIRADRRAMLERAVLLREHGFSSLLIDLQAHGENPGDAITMGYRESQSVRDAVAWARARNPGQPVGIVGWSLGGASTLLATPLEVDAIAVESVFPEITQAVHNRVLRRLGPLHRLLAPALLAQLRPRLGFGPADVRPIDRIAACGCPVLIACGEYDEHTTLEESRRLFEAATEPKQLLVFEGAKHEDLLKFGRRQYEQSVVGFLAEHLQRTER